MSKSRWLKKIFRSKLQMEFVSVGFDSFEEFGCEWLGAEIFD